MKENCIAAYLLIFSIRQLGRKGGLKSASLYLKTASSCLMAYYGGHQDLSRPILRLLIRGLGKKEAPSETCLVRE